MTACCTAGPMCVRAAYCAVVLLANVNRQPNIRLQTILLTSHVNKVTAIVKTFVITLHP